jgi:hypothetical protein
MIASTSALPSPGPPLLDREGKTRFGGWRDGWWSARAEAGLAVSTPAGGREREVLREGVGVVVVTDVAGFLPWATEDTIDTRSVLGFVATEVILESVRAGGSLLGGWGCRLG